MATVVIIHAAEDALPARALAEKLRLAKLTVVLEKQPGEEQREAAKAAQVTIALWSPRSVAQPALVEDAAFARGKSKIVHARMQNAPLPDAFKGDKTVDLTGWRGEEEFPAWRELAKAVTDKAGVAPLPPPAPRPPSGFFQPGRVGAADPAPAGGRQQAPRPAQQPARPAQAPRPQPAAQTPRAQAPRPAPQQPARSYDPAPEPKKGGGMVMIAVITFVVVAALGGGGYYFWSQQQSAQATTTTWDDVPRNDASALRAFLAGNPGAHRQEASAALTQLEEQSFDAARDADTIDGFQGFLNEFPQSSHALEARGRIAELQSMPDQTPGEDTTTTTTTTAPADATNPDLVPPGTTPDASGGPATLTPPAAPTTDATQPPTN
jgi:hypothetical protein